MDDELDRAIDAAFSADRPLGKLERELRDLIDLTQMATADVPSRIRLTVMCPPGMAVLVPYEEDGGVPLLERTVGDGGPKEVLMHPDDWERIVATVPDMSDSPFKDRASFYQGIPVIKDQPNKPTGGEQ